MYKTLTTLALILVSILAAAEEPSKAKVIVPPKTEATEPPKPKPEFTKEQLDQLKASEEKYKDNPAMMNVIKQVKEKSGITDEPPPAPVQETGPPKQAPIQGSRAEADAAYKNKDYEKAIAHYKALAADGDADASLKLGTLYQQGLGTDKDEAAATAWFRKAAEDGSNVGEGVLGEMESTLPDEELNKVDQKYEEINKEISGEGEGGGEDEGGSEASDQQPQAGHQTKDKNESGLSQTNPDISMPVTRHKQVQYVYESQTRIVKITPERIEQMQHIRPAASSAIHLRPEGTVNHLQPEKYIRQPIGRQDS